MHALHEFIAGERLVQPPVQHRLCVRAEIGATRGDEREKENERQRKPAPRGCPEKARSQLFRHGPREPGQHENADERADPSGAREAEQDPAEHDEGGNRGEERPRKPRIVGAEEGAKERAGERDRKDEAQIVGEMVGVHERAHRPHRPELLRRPPIVRHHGPQHPPVPRGLRDDPERRDGEAHHQRGLEDEALEPSLGPNPLPPAARPDRVGQNREKNPGIRGQFQHPWLAHRRCYGKRHPSRRVRLAGALPSGNRARTRRERHRRPGRDLLRRRKDERRARARRARGQSGARHRPPREAPLVERDGRGRENAFHAEGKRDELPNPEQQQQERRKQQVAPRLSPWKRQRRAPHPHLREPPERRAARQRSR